MRPFFVMVAVVLVMAGCRRDPALSTPIADEPFPLELPLGFPPVPIPEDNPLTLASVRLGKALFHDPRLSRDGTISCASCHLEDHAFSDVTPLSVGIEGRLGMRNAPTLGNVAYHANFFRDGGVPTLEQQVIAPVHDAVEMDHDIHLAAAALRDQAPYAQLSMLAYGKPLDASILVKAVANYERTLISGWSRFDRFLRGDLLTLGQAEMRGWELFNSAEWNCTACHGGFDFSDHDLHNVGLTLDYTDNGRERITLDPSDNGKFKTPSLRNVARTAPYMHDGSMSTLEQVIDHFATGGVPHPNKSQEMRNFTITTDQRADVIAFLQTLSDERSMDQVP